MPLRKILGWVVTGGALAFFGQRIAASAHALPAIQWDAAAVSTVFASLALALAAITFSAAIWRVLLDDQGETAPWPRIVPLYFVSQFGKYLPGNVGQYVGRVVLARDAGISVPVTLATMLTELLWNIGTALVLAAGALAIYADGQPQVLPTWANGAGAVMACIALFAAPWVGVTLLRVAFPGLVARVFPGGGLRPPGWRAALLATVLYVGCYAVLGLALKIQARVMFHAGDAPLLQVAGYFALAWLAGFVLPGAPAGVGVREAVMLILFSPLYGESTALALGISLRLTTTAADFLAWAVGWAWRKRLVPRKETT